MGGKNSGRYKRGTKKDKTSKMKVVFHSTGAGGTAGEEPAPKKTEINDFEPDFEHETMDFESNAQRILNESNADLEKQKSKEAPKASPEAEAGPQPEPPKQKEDWSPVVAFVMNVVGTVFANSTGFKELNYTENEIEKCSNAGSEIINVLWPDAKSMTTEQQILLFNSMVLLKVHVDKISLYNELKKKKESELKHETPVAAEAKPAA